MSKFDAQLKMTMIANWITEQRKTLEAILPDADVTITDIRNVEEMAHSVKDYLSEVGK